MTEDKEPVVKDKYHGSPNTSCITCVGATKDIDHVGCSAIKLYVMRTRSGEHFLRNPEYHCKCFRDKPELHYAIADQLKPEDIKAIMALKPKKEDEINIKIDPDETKDVFEDSQAKLD